MRVLLPLTILAGALSAASCSRTADPSLAVARIAAPAQRADEEMSSPAHLRVVVTASEDGAPLSDVLVHVQREPRRAGRQGEEEPPDALESARTGAGGVVRLQVAPGSYVVELDPPAAELARVRVEAGLERELELRLPSLADLEIAVDVVGEETAAPLADALVELIDLPPHVRGATTAARTDAGGRARLRVPSWMQTVAAVTAPGRGELRLALLPEGLGQPVEGPLRARLARAGELRGRLVDPAGAPVAGVGVVARVAAADLFPAGGPHAARRPGEERREREVVQRATSAIDGTFTLALPANAGVVLAAEADEDAGRPRRTLDVVRLGPGEVAERELVLATGTRVEGQLLGPDDAPVAGASVWLVQGGGRRVFTRFEEVHARAVTDAEGRFAFPGVEPGSWRVGPAPRRSQAQVPGQARKQASGQGSAQAIAAVPALVDVVPGLQRAEVVLRPPASLFLSGRTVDADGRPVGGVGLFASGDGQVASGASLADGTFRVGPLVAGELFLRTTASPGIAAGAGRPVRAGDVDLELVVLRTGALRGALQRADGTPPIDAEVSLARGDNGRGAGARRLRADSEGAFHVSDAEPGGYVVVARAEPDLVAAGSVDVPSEGTARVALDLQAGARARCFFEEHHAELVYLVLAGGLPVERGRVDGRSELTTLDFPAGEVAVELHDASGMVARRTGTAATGRALELSFTR